MYFEMFKESDIKHKIHISDFKIEILYKVVSGSESLNEY